MGISCNGIWMQAPKFSEETKQFIKDSLKEARLEFIAQNREKIGRSGCYETWHRFKDDDNIIRTIESATKEGDFLKDPKKWLLAGLENCADRDYYYMHEKDWGME